MPIFHEAQTYGTECDVSLLAECIPSRDSAIGIGAKVTEQAQVISSRQHLSSFAGLIRRRPYGLYFT